jgi:hypothetical protein
MADEMKQPRTWTEHTSNCRFCYRDFYISREAIDELRNFDEYKDQSDAEIAATMDVCLGCLEGTDIEGEHVSGEQNHPEPERGPHGTWTKDPLEGPYWQLINLTPKDVADLDFAMQMVQDSDPTDFFTFTKHGELPGIFAKVRALSDAVKSKGVWPEAKS